MIEQPKKPRDWLPSEVDEIEQQLAVEVLENPVARFNMRLAALEKNIDPDAQPDKAWAAYLDSELLKRIDPRNRRGSALFRSRRLANLIQRIRNYIDECDEKPTYSQIFYAVPNHISSPGSLRRAILRSAPDLRSKIRHGGAGRTKPETIELGKAADAMIQRKSISMIDCYHRMDPQCSLPTFRQAIQAYRALAKSTPSVLRKGKSGRAA